jgi:hypothetical protein
MRATWRCCAPRSERGAGGAGLGHAVAGELGQCRGGQIRAARPDGAVRRGGAARDARHRHARRGPAGAGAGSRRRCARGRGAARGGRTGAAVPQPPRLCAGDALPGLRAPDRLRRIATRGWSSTGSSSGSSATSAARRNPMPEACPSCGVEGKLAAVGPGVERLAEEAAALFPEARIAVLSSDLFGSARALKAQIEEIAEGGADIIIGTQLVAKGHNFPAADAGGRDRRRSGPAGLGPARGGAHVSADAAGGGPGGAGGKPGLALLQTFQPEHPVIRAILSGDEEAFWRAEAAERRRRACRPMAGWRGSSARATRPRPSIWALRWRATTRRSARGGRRQVYGPAPAPIARVRGRHRVRLLVKAPKGAPLQLSSNENPFGPPALGRQRDGGGRDDGASLPLDRSRKALRMALARSTGSTPSGSSAAWARTRSSRFLCQAYAGPGDEVLYPSTGSACTASRRWPPAPRP